MRKEAKDNMLKDKKGSTTKIVMNVLGGVCYAGAGGSFILQQSKLGAGLIILGSIFIFIGELI